MLCAGTTGAQAQEWKLSTNISQQVFYTDNLLLSREREIDTVGFITAPEVLIERNSPTSSVILGGRFEFAEYLDHSDFNSQDQFIDFDVEKFLSERAAFRFDSNFTRDTTLKSDLDADDRFLDDSFRFISWRVGPSFTYQLSPVDEMTVRGSYRQVEYDTTEKVDYQYFGPSLDYNHRLSELSQFTSSFTAFRYIPEESGDDYTDTYGILLGYAYDPSERLSVSGAAGVAYSIREEDDPGNDDRDSDEVGYRFRFNLRYELSDAASVRLALSHDQEPSGDGDQVTRNRVSTQLRYRVTPLTVLGFNADYSDNVDALGFEGSSSSDEDDERSRYFSLRPSVGWNLTEDLFLVAEYRYRHKVFEEGPSADSNTVYLTLQYNFPTIGGEGP